MQAPGVPEEPEAEPEAIDLMAVLKQSLKRAGVAERARAAARERKDSSIPASDLAERSKSQLYERAKELDIPGRSKMNKDELISAIRKAS